MNRRALLISATAMSLATSTARAEMPVVDMASILQQIKQIEWLRDQYQLGTQQLHATTNTLDLNGVAPQLLGSGVQNPFGQIAGQINGIVRGTTTGGIPGAQQMLQQDRAYTATGNDFTAATMNNSSTSLASLKAQEIQLINVNEERISALNQMQAELQAAPDVATVERINGRIALENQALAAQQAQIHQLQGLIALQEQTNNARYQQRIRSDDEETTAAISGGNADTATGSPQVATTATFQAGN